MSFIDVYNAETITTGSSSVVNTIVTAIVTLGSTFLGIYIKYSMDERSRKKKLKRDGENFEAEINLLELQIKRQVVAIENYKKNLENESFNVLLDSLVGRLDGILKLDRTDIIEYFETKEDKKPKSYVINVFGGVLALSDIPKNLTTLIEETPKLINPLVIKYGDLMNELIDNWYKFKTQLTDEQSEKLPLEDFYLLTKKYFGTRNLSITKNIQLIDTLHKDLQDKKFIRREPFFIYLQQCNSKAIVILNHLSNERKKELFYLNTCILTLKNQYKRIYGYEMDLTGVTE